MVSHSLVVRSYWSVVKGISWKHASDSWRYIWQSSIWGIANMESGCKKRFSKSECVRASICECTCVSEWEREKERDVFNVSLQHCLHLSSTLSAVPARREKIRMWTREIEKNVATLRNDVIRRIFWNWIKAIKSVFKKSVDALINVAWLAFNSWQIKNLKSESWILLLVQFCAFKNWQICRKCHHRLYEKIKLRFQKSSSILNHSHKHQDKLEVAVIKVSYKEFKQDTIEVKLVIRETSEFN